MNRRLNDSIVYLRRIKSRHFNLMLRFKRAIATRVMVGPAIGMYQQCYCRLMDCLISLSTTQSQNDSSIVLFVINVVELRMIISELFGVEGIA